MVMKSIYEYLQELERESIKRCKEAAEAGENSEWDSGYQTAILEIESWIDANKKEIETITGYVFDAVNAD